jgi:diguanylate cyclase (GGDEF)-like protein/PAS domain S-box-containing protein
MNLLIALAVSFVALAACGAAVLRASIRRNLALLRSTIDSTDEGIVVADREGRVVLHNKRAAELWGNEFARAIDPHSDAEEKTSDVVHLDDGRVLERCSIPHRHDGRIVGRVWTFRDATAERAVQRAVEASEKRYRMLFERNLAGVYTCNTEGTITDCNQAFARMLGVATPAMLIGHRIGQYHVAPGERHEINNMLASALTIPGVELTLKKVNGESLRVLESVSRIEIDGATLFQSTVVDINDLKRAEEQIRFHAYHDVLTCLPNRQLFRDRLRIGIAHARRSQSNTAVMFIDLDDFKKVNDTLGHTIGDEALVLMAERLSSVLRKGDTLARPGGDEFQVLVAEVNSTTDAERIARKLLHTIAKPLSIGPREIFLTASIGIALFPADGADEESLMKSADNALFEAKQMGRNTHRASTLELNRRATERFIVENSLRTSVERGEFILHYQPIVDGADTQRFIAFEALVRWQHPERGLLMPIDFIRIAEQTSLIVALGEWVLRRACADAAAWQGRGMSGVRVAVNISQKQLQQPEFATMVNHVLDETGLRPDLLELEITESVAAQDPDATSVLLNELRATGVRVSIDDIGTGYSSLAYLKQFPVSTVKIDKSFVSNVTSDRSDEAIVAAVIGVAHSLDMDVVAEGVEREEQAAFLRQHHCNAMQGFLFGEPMLIEDWLLPSAETALIS